MGYLDTKPGPQSDAFNRGELIELGLRERAFTPATVPVLLARLGITDSVAPMGAPSFVSSKSPDYQPATITKVSYPSDGPEFGWYMKLTGPITMAASQNNEKAVNYSGFDKIGSLLSSSMALATTFAPLASYRDPAMTELPAAKKYVPDKSAAYQDLSRY